MTFEALHLLSIQRSFPKFLGFHHFLNLTFLQDQTRCSPVYCFFLHVVCGFPFLYTFSLWVLRVHWYHPFLDYTLPQGPLSCKMGYYINIASKSCDKQRNDGRILDYVDGNVISYSCWASFDARFCFCLKF